MFNWYLRSMGAKIGKGVCALGCNCAELDMVTVGDGTGEGRAPRLQTMGLGGAAAKQWWGEPVVTRLTSARGNEAACMLLARLLCSRPTLLPLPPSHPRSHQRAGLPHGPHGGEPRGQDGLCHVSSTALQLSLAALPPLLPAVPCSPVCTMPHQPWPISPPPSTPHLPTAAWASA